MISAILLCAAAIGANTDDYVFSRVIDGDTFVCIDSKGREHTVRLYGIDAPERSQPFGDAAAPALKIKLEGKILTIKITGRDQHGRSIREIAKVMASGEDVNQAMVTEGMAWWYKEYARKSKELQEAEREARDAKRGLWVDSDPTPPWQWRKSHRQKLTSASR